MQNCETFGTAEIWFLCGINFCVCPVIWRNVDERFLFGTVIDSKASISAVLEFVR